MGDREDNDCARSSGTELSTNGLDGKITDRGLLRASTNKGLLDKSRAGDGRIVAGCDGRPLTAEGERFKAAGDDREVRDGEER